ncbi:helix-turn-helix transcriptional regulator [Streptosporangium sp. NBC_01639]|uniref:winged helix-turn-helix transcriptional regulator n=1 Tax=Streptosporangium sp. NBC_01639 TaxID=2975948 RepID=UPI0038680A35|nr:helix-turn-helix transcriptional regulator [Streptosporangium sp. NBC_01639]
MSPPHDHPTDVGVAVPVTPDEHESCPATAVLRRVGDKWTPVVLSLLAGGSRGFNELDRSVEGLSRRMLTRTLRTLERDGLVSRTAHPGAAARVEYTLTHLGHSLRESLLVLSRWAVVHDDDLRAARAGYDATHVQPGIPSASRGTA